jgi:hypothetical protein
VNICKAEKQGLGLDFKEHFYLPDVKRQHWDTCITTFAYRDREDGDNGRTPGPAQLPLDLEALCAARSIRGPLGRERLPMLTDLWRDNRRSIICIYSIHHGFRFKQSDLAHNIEVIIVAPPFKETGTGDRSFWS